MMMRTKTSSQATSRRALLVGALGLVGSTGCGYILHPERRKRANVSGEVDTTVLVFDLLWLLPGLIPGIICLAVDFGTGAIYGSPTTVQISSRRRPRARVEVELDGGVVAEAQLAGAEPPRLASERAIDAAALEARGRVRVHGPNGEVAEADAASLLATLRTQAPAGG
ncbi:MAG: hypothetical protein FJ095_16270 [Deltaproteobacteria bacterium]|nr:hypothetical protein [Deltaproteobacteria bacterium]